MNKNIEAKELALLESLCVVPAFKAKYQSVYDTAFKKNVDVRTIGDEKFLIELDQLEHKMNEAKKALEDALDAVSPHARTEEEKEEKVIERIQRKYGLTMIKVVYI